MSSRQEPDFVDQWEAAYRERIKQLEAQVTMLTDREQQAIASIAAYKQAYKERVGYLEGQVSALTEAAIQREGRADPGFRDRIARARRSGLPTTVAGKKPGASFAPTSVQYR